MATITCYDGVACIGGNKILLEDGDTRLWLDFGLDFGRMGLFYEEFVQPKTCLGLYEPLQMGLLPPIKGLYRPDLECALADPWDGLQGRDLGRVDGILLSHTHVDHLGALAYVRGDIPVYASAMTMAIAKSMQDTGSGIDTHYCYTVPYQASENGELTSRDRKDPSRSRPLVFVDEQPGAEFLSFWDTTPGCASKSGRPHEATPMAVSSTCGGLSLRRFPVDHSVFGACAWALETSAGWVVYSGDLRCHGRNGIVTTRSGEELAMLKPRALIIEGTRIASEDTSTEDEVAQRALDEVRKAKGLVIADFGPRNIERLASFLAIAKETGRTLLLLPKDAYLLEKMALADASGALPSMTDESIRIYTKYEASAYNWKKAVYETYPDKLVEPGNVASNQDRYICCFSFFDVNELACLKPIPGSIWIYSSCEAFNEEMRIDLKRLTAWLDHFGVAPLGLTEDNENNPFHVSGHACKKDLLKLVDIIRPQILIPVHTEHPAVYQQELRGKCEVRLPVRGEPITV